MAQAAAKWPEPLEFPETTIPDDEDARKAALVQLVADTVPEFKGATLADVAVSVLSGGITNQLYRVKRNDTGFSVVARVFGKQTERLISRAAEQYWQEAFLRTYARAANALVYEFLDDHVPLQPDDLPAHADHVAKAMATLHVEAAARSLFHVPYANERIMADVVLDDWMGQGTAPETLAKLQERGHDVAKKFGDLALFKEHAARLSAAIARVAHLVPVVPCHNDLLSLNIMLGRKTGAVRLIDFEYMRRNYYLGDIANHFCEWGGFDCDWAKFPSTAVQRRFMEEYLAVAMVGSTAAQREVALKRAMALLPLFALWAHYLWASWALVQGAYSVIDFDYVTFGGQRFARYLATCDEAYAEAANVE